MTTFIVDCWLQRSFEFDPAKTALLVIDMQRHFLEYGEAEDVAETTVPADANETAALAEDNTEPDDGDVSADADVMEDPSEIIPRVAHLLALARQMGCYIVHTREGYAADLNDVSPFRRDLDYIGHPGPLGRSLIRGEPGHDFVPELQPLTGECVIDKASFGAFYRTELDAKLREAGIERLILCGVTTQCCVHSTLREAVDRGYWCLTVADCCAASEPGLHEAALMLIAGEGHLFGWIADLAEIENAVTPAIF